MLPELCRMPLKELRGKMRNLIGVYDIRGQPLSKKIADNYTNRIVLGYDLKKSVEQRDVSSLLHTHGLKDFQVLDVLKMVNSNAFLNRNKMGSGKTIETVIALRERNFKRILIVCPKPVIGQWVYQTQYWWPQKVGLVDVVDHKTQVLQHGVVYVTNYEKLIAKKTQETLLSKEWDCVVLDEAHYIKNRKALRTINAKKLKANCKWALTGTPILKTPDDLFSIFEFLNPEISGSSYWDFVNYYCHVNDGYFGKQIEGLTKNEEHVKTLGTILEKISCYNDITIAQGKRVIPVKLLMDENQRIMYNKVKQLILDELPEDMSIPNGAVKLIRLLQLTSAPQIHGIKTPGVKFEWILDYLETAIDEKIVVFSRYEQVVVLLKQYLQEHKICAATYTGKLKDDTRELEKRKFLTDKNCRVLIGTIGALGTGVDGLQDVSSTCIFLDRADSPEVNKQCEDRVHRTNQRKEVKCYYLECTKTVDEKIARVNLNRAEDIRRALSNE